MKPLLIILCLFAVTGCVSPKKGATWYNPTTWFKGAEATASDKAQAKTDAAKTEQDAAREQLIKDAQKDVAAATHALASAPTSPPAELAKILNTRAGDSLTQAVGGLLPDILSALRKMVDDALSADAARRASGENALQTREAENATLANKLAEADAKLEALEASLRAKQDELRAAFDRENAVANAYRNQRFLMWGGIALSLVLGAAYLYARVALGGIPGAIGKGMAVLRARDPDAASAAEQIFDGLLNRHEQQRISRHS